MNPATDPLAGLRDIHLPMDPSWWPPAPGWWLLALFIIVSAVLLIRYIVKRRRKSLPSRELITRLQNLKLGSNPAESQNALIEISRLVRRFAVTRYGRSRVAGLTGGQWLEFLDHASQSSDFSNGPGKLLAEGPYRAQSDNEMDDLVAVIVRLAKLSPATNPEP
ncbi:MAG: DUF4381 domain-containing protein [bacterium]